MALDSLGLSNSSPEERWRMGRRAGDKGNHTCIQQRLNMLPAIAHFFDCTRRRPVGYELPLTYLCFKI